jgi:hypothetical protein
MAILIKYSHENGYRKSKNKRYNNWYSDSHGFNSHINPFSSQLVLCLFVLFTFLIIVDYFLTIYNIAQHTQEFNPVVVFIYDNFEYPELFFLTLKIIVITLTGLLLFGLKMWKNTHNKKISTFYIFLASFFAFAVVLYDIAIILNIDISFINQISLWFFKTMGLT